MLGGQIARGRKQRDIKNSLNCYPSGLICLLETKRKARNMGAFYLSLFQGYCFTSNSVAQDSGRIFIGWNPNSFSLNIMNVSSQMIHCFVSPIHATAGFDCSIVYAHNDRNDREALWNDFYNLSQKVG